MKKFYKMRQTKAKRIVTTNKMRTNKCRWGK